MEKIRSIQLASLTRRVVSYILDLVFLTILFLFTYLPTVEGYVDFGFHINDKLYEAKKIQVESGLFFDDTEEGEEPYSQVNYVSTEKLTDENGYFTYDKSHMVFLEMLYHFYYVYLNDINEYDLIFESEPSRAQLNEWFYSNVCSIDNEDYPNDKAFYIINGDKTSDPMTYDENGNLTYCNIGVLDTVTFNGVTYSRDDTKDFKNSENQAYIRASIRIFADTDYYPGTYHQACFYLRETSEYYDLYTSLEAIGRYSLYISLGIAVIIYYLLLPLCFKNGETLSMLILRIGLVNKEGYQVKKIQVFTKYLFLAVEAFVGYFTLFIFYLIDFGIVVFTKKHQSISDFISLTMIINTKDSVWFQSRKVEEELLKQVNENIKKDTNLREK